ncbi:fimbria/pilus outer membrane usher protein [Vibrio gallicus]|uniref:fimbria/pilus outer membrane usher protein n=1 Tax=Vibrio gallicus TaxID=190897 RepID=UPI0021C259E7|nr:fimbria/pilus outer membrane usher protein [Vibrio gallicus]
MIRLLSTLLCIFFFSWVYANQWTFPVPLYRGQTQISEINIVTDGERLIGISATELHERLKNYLAPDVNESLLRFGNKVVSQQELQDMGIELTFDNLDLSLTLSLEKDRAKRNEYSFDIPYEKPIYSESGFFAWHNIFNLTASYVDSEQDTQQTDWRFEWVASSNFGGYQGLNIDGALYVAPENLADDSDNIQVYRGDVRAFVDRPDYPMRFSVGDINPFVTGHLPSVPLGGVAMERLWNRLQPTRNIQSGGSQEVYLVESATVSVYVNDTFYGDLRLPPGRYDIDDLPLRQGNNDIRLEIRYQSGRREEITYSQFFNTRLLRQGYSDYGIYAGVVSNVADREYIYDEQQYVVQSYVDYGLTDAFTVGINGIYHPLGQIAGMSLGLGTGFANIGLRASALHYQEQQVDSPYYGAIVSLDYASSVWGNLGYNAPNFRVGVEGFTDYRATPWSAAPLETGGRALLDYTYRMTSYLSLNSYVEYDMLTFPEQNELFAQLELQVGYQDFELTIGADYLQNKGAFEFEETTYYFIVEWDWYSDSGEYEALAQYFSRGNVARTAFSKYSSNSVGSYGYQLLGEYGDEAQLYEARADYIGNRFSAEVDVNRVVDNQDIFTANTVSGRLSSGLTVVDSDVSWNRGYRGPAAIIKVHDSIQVPVNINEYEDQSPEASATSSLNNSTSLYGHSYSSFNVTIPEADIGYDYGSGYYQIVPGSNTGHVVTVGSDESKTVIGTLKLSNGDAVILRNGVVSGEGITRSIFTNKAGRFAIDRMKSGRYTVTIIGTPELTGDLIIEQTSDNLIYLQALTLREVSP